MDSARTPYVVIPAAGVGQRFADVGFTTAKPFIPIWGKAMVQHVMDTLPEEWPVVLVLQDALDVMNVKRTELLLAVDTGRKLTKGQAHSVAIGLTRLLDVDRLRKDTPILILNSDNVIRIDWRAWWRRVQGLRGSIATFEDRTPDNDAPFSYCAVDNTGAVTHVREKHRISSHACAGAFHFAAVGDYLHAYERFVAERKRYSNVHEEYVSEVYNHLHPGSAAYLLHVRDQQVHAYRLREEEIIRLGTPKDVIENYERLQS